MRIILFNGPPRSGKDTATRLAMEILNQPAFVVGNLVYTRRSYHYRFAQPLKDAIHALFGVGHIHTESYDSVKDTPSGVFFGMSAREAYIWLSEEVVKKRFGKDFFAKVAVTRIKQFDDALIVISDCGFQEEVDVLIKEFGTENVYVVRIHRNGTSFEGDSRNYVSHPKSDILVRNNGSIEELTGKIKLILEEIIT